MSWLLPVEPDHHGVCLDEPHFRQCGLEQAEAAPRGIARAFDTGELSRSTLAKAWLGANYPAQVEGCSRGAVTSLLAVSAVSPSRRGEATSQKILSQSTGLSLARLEQKRRGRFQKCAKKPEDHAKHVGPAQLEKKAADQSQPFKSRRIDESMFVEPRAPLQLKRTRGGHHRHLQMMSPRGVAVKTVIPATVEGE